MVTLLRKRAALELEYAKGMSKLAQSFKPLVPAEKQRVAEAQEGEFRDSLWGAWFTILDDLQFSALQHVRRP